MTCDRKKPGVAFWATVVVIVVLVGYPLSFGPVCRATSGERDLRFLARFYKPLIVAVRYPGWKLPRRALVWYGGENGEYVFLTVVFQRRQDRGY